VSSFGSHIEEGTARDQLGEQKTPIYDQKQKEEKWKDKKKARK